MLVTVLTYCRNGNGLDEGMIRWWIGEVLTFGKSSKFQRLAARFAGQSY